LTAATPTPLSLRLRQVHLDFHTSPLIPDIGRDFDADTFAATVETAHIDSITCFAKCHHGMSYYPTKAGKVHPGLDFDLLGAQIEACHRRGIRVPIYLTCVWDNHMAEQHPDWQQRKADGSLIGPEPGKPGWKWICLNSPYLDYQEEQTKELLDLYECDGFFYDIVFQAIEMAGRDDSGCCCEYCLASMKKRNLNPESYDDQRAHTRLVTDNFMSRLTSLIRARKPEATTFYNSRVHEGMGREASLYSHFEIEALPTGGWGYAFFPFWVRYARTFGLPTMGMTGRFHRSWADFGGLKSPAALKYECGSMLANGSACSIGDQLHPRGALDRAVYQVMGEAFRDVEAKEPWCDGAEPVTEVALLVLDPSPHKGKCSDSDAGAAKALLELRHQFDILDADADWSEYSALVIADSGQPNPELVGRLRAYLRKGGKLLLSHEALVDPETEDFALAEEMGINYVGPLPHTPSFFRLRPNFLHGLRDFEYVMIGGGSSVRPGPMTDVMADAYGSYFNRTEEHFTSHSYSPHAGPAGTPAITWFGNVAYLCGPFFRDYQREGDTSYRRVIGNALDLLLPQRLLVVDAPPSVEATVTRQAGRIIVHLVNYQPNRRGAHVEVIEEVAPLRDVRVRLRLTRAPSRVYIAPDEQELAVDYAEGRATVTVPIVHEHGMVVFEE
jgi:hypothetical protein